jgi:hypothetical protein
MAVASLTASAASIINNTGIASPAQTITFSEFVFATDTPITNQFAGLGVTFSPSMYYNTQPNFFPTDFLANFSFGGDPTHNPVSILFAQDQTAAAFAMQTNPGTSTFEAFLNGVFLESFSAATTLSFLPDLTNASNYYGFTGIVFDEIRVTSGTTFFQIDNLQLSSSVPEAGTLALLGFALAGLGFSRRRKLH